MRKIFLLACASLCLCTQAQSLKPVITVSEEDNRFAIGKLPGMYSADLKSHVVIYAKEEKKIKILNDDLETLAEIDCSPYVGKEFAENKHVTKYLDKATGEWKEEIIAYDINNLGLIAPTDIENLSASEAGYVLVTQTVFNNDKNYEFIVYTNGEPEIGSYDEQDKDHDGVTDYIQYSEYAVRKGFKIVQDNGNVLASVEIEDGYKLDNMDIYDINGKYYICALIEDAEHNYYNRFYSFDKGDATSLKAVRTERVGIKALPAIARQNEMVSIDISGVKDARAVTLTNSSGQTLKQLHFEPGQRNVVVNTSGLSAGMYVVNVTDGSRIKENCKIIIR